jgi:hypothetical protein
MLPRQAGAPAPPDYFFSPAVQFCTTVSALAFASGRAIVKNR